MLAKERQNRILSIIQENNSIRISDIINTFHVSHETARRDLDTLQDQNLVTRVHGGAVLSEKNTTSEMHDITGSPVSSSMSERVAIGKAAASMIKEGETVFLSVGLTVQQVAKALKKRKNITVITNSVLVLNELLNSDIQLYILGGVVNSSENNIEGSLATKTLLNFYVDTAFIGAGGVSKELGISDYSLEVAKLNENIIEHAKKTVLVAHSRKFGTSCLSITCPLDKIDTIISDKKLPLHEQNHLTERGIETILVG